MRSLSVNPLEAPAAAEAADATSAHPAYLAEQVGQFRPFLIRLAERMVGRELRNRVAVSDVVQLTLLTAVRDLSRFRGESEQAIREWLVVILRHRIVDESRRLRLCKKRDCRRDQPLEVMHLPSPGRGVASGVIAREQVSRLLNAIEALHPLDRAIVRARYLEDQTFEEIGRQFSMSHDAVRRRWLKVMEAIGRNLGKGTCT